MSSRSTTPSWLMSAFSLKVARDQQVYKWRYIKQVDHNDWMAITLGVPRIQKMRNYRTPRPESKAFDIETSSVSPGKTYTLDPAIHIHKSFPIDTTTKLISRRNSTLVLPEKRILIVDDEPLIVKTIESFLRKDGFTQVYGETDSRRAIKAINDYQPEMLLLDILMPHICGLKLLEQICGTPDFDEIICLMVSSAGDDEEGKAFEIGALGFIPKPVCPEELIRIIATTFRIADRFGTR